MKDWRGGGDWGGGGRMLRGDRGGEKDGADKIR